MVQQLVKDMLVHEHPVEAADDVELDTEDPAALDQFQFYVKTNCSGQPRLMTVDTIVQLWERRKH